MEVSIALPAPSPWPRRLVRFGVGWAMFLIPFTVISEPTRENWTLSISIAFSGLYTWLLYQTRSRWLPRFSRTHPLRYAMAFGIFNAALIETVFLLIEKFMEAEGVAAHPNLLLDLILTMPWYIGMVIIFVRMHHRRRFSAPTILLLGGLYEVGADGIVGGGIMGLLGGDLTLFSPVFWLFLVLFAYWEFILVYSSMVLPPAWIVNTLPRIEPPPTSARRDALRPLKWLVPFTIYLVIVLIILSGVI